MIFIKVTEQAGPFAIINADQIIDIAELVEGEPGKGALIVTMEIEYETVETVLDIIRALEYAGATHVSASAEYTVGLPIK